MPEIYSPGVQTFSVTNGGTSEILLAGSQNRTSVLIQPLTEACLINFGATAGLQAGGVLTFAANATAAETIAVNGVTFTFVAGASTSTNVHIGASKDLTAVELAAVLNASANASVSVATYTAVADTVVITYDAGGTDGNAFTLADSSGGHVTRSAATLANGSNTVGGIYLAQYGILNLNARDLPEIKNDIYIISATSAAKVSYTYGAG